MSAGVRRLGALAVGATLALAALVTPAHAEEFLGRVEGVRPSDGGVDVSIRALQLPGGVELERDTVHVELDGKRVAASASTPAQASAGLGVRRVMLVLDTSGSMQGGRLDGAKAAAQTYLREVPADVEVGVIAFAASPTVLVAPTPDRTLTADAVAGLVASGETSLYDAVAAAGEALGSEGDRRLLVLSDGADSASARSLADAAASVRASGTALDAVVLGAEPEVLPAVSQLAQAGRGRVLQAEDAVETTAAFRSAANAFSSRMVVHVPVDPALAGHDVAMTVRVDSSAGPVEARSTLTLPGTRDPGFWGSRTALASGLGVFLVGFLGLLLLLLPGRRSGSSRSRTQEALARYTLLPVTLDGASDQADTRLGSSSVARSAVSLAERIVAKRGMAERLALRLERAAVGFTPSEWLVIQATAALFGVGVGIIMMGPLGGLLFGLLGGLGAHLWLQFKGKRRAKAFTEAMPDALQLIAGGLATGYSLPQALDATVREGQEVIATEFGRALAEARLGVALEDALDNVADRMDSKDFRWVVMAVRVQREVGGNLSEVLTTVCATMRDRATLRRQVAAISAEGRLSATVLTGLPIFMGLFQLLFRRDYFQPMLDRPIGLVLLLASAVALALGGFVMKKLVQVEM